MTTQRREPSQQRSRERVERILSVAIDLISAQGSEALRMSEVAERAEISIGSLYQYFPDKASIIRVLAERYNEQGRDCVARALADVHAKGDVTPILHRIVDEYYAMFLENPTMRDIWSSLQGDKSLQALDAADGEAHTKMLTDTLVRVFGARRRASFEVDALVAMQAIASTTRFAITLPRALGDKVVASFKRRMLHDELFDA